MIGAGGMRLWLLRGRRLGERDAEKTNKPTAPVQQQEDEEDEEFSLGKRGLDSIYPIGQSKRSRGDDGQPFMNANVQRILFDEIPAETKRLRARDFDIRVSEISPPYQF